LILRQKLYKVERGSAIKGHPPVGGRKAQIMNAVPQAIVDLADEIRSVLGPRGVSTDPADIDPLLTDWRGRWRGEAPILIRPQTTSEAAFAVEACARRGVCINPQGGNTGLVNGGIPQGEALFSMRRMNRVREVDALNDAMILEAGVVLTDAQAAAERVDRLFPLSLGAEGVATIGGLVSTNAGGVAVLRYGMMRDLTLGLEAVLPDGRIFSGLRALRKDNTGYDLKHLFIGAEGTLGLITAVSVKLFPRPAARETAWAAIPSVDAAVRLLALFKKRTGGAVTGFELVSDLALTLVLRHVPNVRDPLPSELPWRVLVEVSSGSPMGLRETVEGCLVEAAEAGLLSDAAIAETTAQARMMWSIRESIAVAERAHGKAVKHDVSVPVSSLPAFMAEAETLIARQCPGADIIAFGHVGDGNMHYNVTPPPGVDPSEWVEGDGVPLSHAVHDLIMRHNGSISAEHGIGRLKRDELADRKDAVEMDLMRLLKRAIDPQGLFNPGRVL
jgi:FAD/FMN-containing dehydrogenase